ncbi:hypothetical protein [Burkholderia anthina]|uniref:hypothetical protein n=1 Tax=Burkholderia anthina TaxID=179879 RepID=UPI0015891953|nr:hypothetical protein [Burkholderia anthina]
MKKAPFVVLAATLFLVAVAITTYVGEYGSMPDNGRAANLPTPIQLGEPKDSDFGGSGASLDNHPSGMRFYERDWVRGNLGVVEIEHGKYSFVLENVLSATGVSDSDLPGGIFKWNVNFGVSPEQADTHAAALERMTKLFSDLRSKGWVRYVDTGHPRLTGKQAWGYFKTNSIYSLDSSYTPSIDEWVAVVSHMPYWRFYADGVYLDVSLMESNMGGFVGKTTYLLTVSIRNEYAFYGVGYFPGKAENIRNWKALITPELQKYHAKRLATEAALKKQGYTIDTTCQDPPIYALRSASPRP